MFSGRRPVQGARLIAMICMYSYKCVLTQTRTHTRVAHILTLASSWPRTSNKIVTKQETKQWRKGVFISHFHLRSLQKISASYVPHVDQCLLRSGTDIEWVDDDDNEKVKLNEWVSEWVSGWVNEWVSEWVSEWMSEGVSEWVGGWVSGWVGEWVSEWMGGRVRECVKGSVSECVHE